MLKVASLIWIMLGTTLGGILVIAVLVAPALADRATQLIPAAFIAGAVLAMPLSYVIARRIQGTRRV